MSGCARSTWYGAVWLACLTACGASPATHSTEAASTRAPPEAEQHDSVAQVGVRPGDADGDEIGDARDDCPHQPETYNGIHDKDGCPDHADVGLDSSVIGVMYFKAESAAIPDTELLELHQMLKLLQEQRDVRLMEIGGHADETEAAAARLSEDRASVVKTWLVRHGVEPSRLAIRAFGSDCPSSKNRFPENIIANRSATFRVLETRNGAEDLPKCPRSNIALPEYLRP